ncbi:monosaccharide ABC transporter ATP-binding protein, CUT2 family [Pseudonocardia thermophila]|uniref:Monosaccharide ABC transporter ATP-binding protein, CUT2 family n=1 Tax=Pseudonocardia thermophila TaxID=1848 RepID=A0A1M6PML9_PSETH|nr:sugar ABC transporter ATP-binding protein [Pseudonocardia thermophila]SHK09205.1 monosaccharide ABC transporter ATP-binding protein, CUT2 family [Pseudonocardia thermophila]
MSPTDPPAIEVDRVSKWFGPTRALDDVSFAVAKGQSRALLGRNGAGKSTLVSLITGIARPDTGELRIVGEPLHGQDDRIGCVYQRSSLIPAFTAAENVLIKHYPRRRGGLIHWRELRERARGLLDEWTIGDLADEPVERLQPMHKKIVEICRALVSDPEVLILDEPTAGLDKSDTARLFALLERLRERGTTVLYISHHLEDVFRVCDSVTVLRDARHVLTAGIGDVTMAQLVEAIVGEQPPSAVTRPPRASEAPVVLSVRDVRVDDRVGPVDLELRAGECIGIAGLEGCGKATLARALVGLEPRSGEVVVDGREVEPGDVPEALRAGIGYVPEDRHVDGMVSVLDVSENSTMALAPRIGRRPLGFLPRLSRRADLDRAYAELARQWRIVASSPRQLISELSGGNQQKCVMARAFATDPRLLVLVNPTAGVDVSAKASILASLSSALDRGAGVLVFSEDADDFALCDRILIMIRGSVVAVLDEEWTEADLVAAMQGEAA